MGATLGFGYGLTLLFVGAAPLIVAFYKIVETAANLTGVLFTSAGRACLRFRLPRIRHIWTTGDLHKILIIGSGPIVIGQACEFDYSGTQACKALKAEGYEVVLVNSNPATIMTDPEVADATYVEPLTVEYLEAIIALERPDAVLPTVGGQTALNLSIELAESGVLDKYNVQLIGASLKAIKMAEDRLWFKDAMIKVGLDVPKSVLANKVESALKFAKQVGFPLIIRPSFTLGGTGAGMAYNVEELDEKVRYGLELSPVHEVLVEESVEGWKEYELEVMRDHMDNAVVVCSIENLDPMGVHTGDSITVAPAQTLTDKEYQMMRDAAFKVIRVVGVETGGSNIQFAISPETGRMIVIEMNPRVSRSSALASKATGFPIAKIAARLAVGYTLDEIPNDITKKTPSCFEPTIDYVVVKIPKWAQEKFPDSDHTLGPQMKSVGEVMAIGRTFKEALMKGIRSLETGRKPPRPLRSGRAGAPLGHPSPGAALGYFERIRSGFSPELIHEITRIDPWFLNQFQQISRPAPRIQALHAGECSRSASCIWPSSMDFPTTFGGYLAEDRGRCPSAAQGFGRSAGLQARRYLRGGIRILHALSLFHLRRRKRSGAQLAQEDHDPGQRAQPHRAGN